MFFLKKIIKKIINKAKYFIYLYKLRKNFSNTSNLKNKKNKYPLSGYYNYDYNYNPKTSVIISNFNAEKTLIRSLKNLSEIRKEIEIIIVNDQGLLSSNLNKALTNSNDLIINSRDLGECLSYKNGANVSRSSDYLIFCQSDDLIPSDSSWYKDCIKEFKKDKELGLISLNGGGFYGKNFEPINFRKTKKFPIKEYCSWLKFGPFIIKRDIYFSIGGFKSLSLVGETANAVDRLLTLEVIKYGYKAMLFINKNTEKWKRREGRDDGLSVDDLRKLKNRNISFKKTEKLFLNTYEKDIKNIQKKFKV